MHASTRPSALPPVGLTLICAAALHWWLWPANGVDIGTFLVPWFDHIRSVGPVAVFAKPFGNYAPIYLYLLSASTALAGILPAVTLIKLLSVAGTATLAGAVYRLLQALDAHEPARGAALVFLMPSTLINAALMGQCDAMWSAACIMALAAAIRRRHVPMLAWFGLGVAFKLQAMFFAPFLLALLINRRVSFRLWPVAPLVTLATLVPAWLVGWHARDLLMIYLHQAGYATDLALNAPNIWEIVQELPVVGALPPLTALAFAAAIGASAAYVAWLSSRPSSNQTLLAAALLAPLIVVGLLPRMHERYFFLADILALALALTLRSRRGWTIAALIQFGSTAALLAYLSGIHAIAMFGAVAMIAATIRVARPLFAPAANDNLIARAAQGSKRITVI